MAMVGDHNTGGISSRSVDIVDDDIPSVTKRTWPQNGGFGTHLHHNATDEISKRTDRID